MLYAHQGKVINTDEVEFLLLGKDSANVYMTNGAKHAFLSGAEDLIDTFLEIPHITVGPKIFMAHSVSTINRTASMATIEMKSGYRETVSGEERVRAIMDEIECAAMICDAAPFETTPASPQSAKVMTETTAPRGGTARRRNPRSNGGI